jgi:hypothetical protein
MNRLEQPLRQEAILSAQADRKRLASQSRLAFNGAEHSRMLVDQMKRATDITLLAFYHNNR